MQAFSRLTAVVALFGLFNSCLAGYSLQDDYSGANFFGMFDFFTDTDPTAGYVDYVTQSAAQSAGLINTNNNQIYMGVDSKNVASGRGRKSVRVTSKAQYNHGLIVLDLEHMPGSICGVWPAFWTVGPDWPSSGEIDIIEGVNSQNHNAMTLHTGPGCSISSHTSPNTGSSDAAAIFSGSVATSNCDVNAQGQAQNAGCSIDTSDSSSYGDGLNAVNGGVYATEWTSNVIRMWFFPRGKIPSDLATSPDPSGWGTPYASFASASCNIDANFKNQQIVFDTTFCGAWAGSVWSQDSTCSSKAATCQDFVQNNPQAFANAYWTINSLKVFTGNSSVAAPSTSKPASSLAPSSSRPPVATNSSVSMARPIPSTSAPMMRPTPSTSTPLKASAISSLSSSKPSALLTTLPSSTNLATQTTSEQNQFRTRSWSWGSRPGRFFAGRSLAEQTAAPEPVTLPRPLVRIDHQPEDIDMQMVRRHMSKHKRHHADF